MDFLASLLKNNCQSRCSFFRNLGNAFDDCLGQVDRHYAFAGYPNQEVCLRNSPDGSFMVLHYPEANADLLLDVFLADAQWINHMSIT